MSSAAPSKVLGVDAGERRIGLALSDELHVLASPVAILERRHGLRRVLDELLDLTAREHVERIIVGLPLNADGSEGLQARRARDFAAVAERVLGVPITLWDERLSTQEARTLLRARGGRTPRHVDAAAAAVILQDYLDAQRRDVAC